MVSESALTVGVDIGGTTIVGVTLDGAANVVDKLVRDTPVGGYGATVEHVNEIVVTLEERAGSRCEVGIGCPGSVSPATGLTKNSNCTWLLNRPFARDLEDRLKRGIRIDNDANCFIRAEVADGAAKGHAVAVGVVLASGVGSGLAVDGRTLCGLNAVAGEWGHNPLPWPNEGERPGDECYCGKRGCIETFLSGPGFVSHHRALAGESLAAEAIVSRSEAGDEKAGMSVKLYAERLAKGLATIINVVDPDVIVLGGGMSKIRGLEQTVRGQLERWVFSDRVATPVLRSHHGDLASARGAAMLWAAT